MKILHLTLTRQWFDLISSGEKREEYREIKPYWAKRLLWLHERLEADELDELCADLCVQHDGEKRRHYSIEELLLFFNAEFAFFQEVSANNGYAKGCPNVRWKHKGIRIGEGRPEWGAEPGKQYFILSIGDLVTP